MRGYALATPVDMDPLIVQVPLATRYACMDFESPWVISIFLCLWRLLFNCDWNHSISFFIFNVFSTLLQTVKQHLTRKLVPHQITFRMASPMPIITSTWIHQWINWRCWFLCRYQWIPLVSFISTHVWIASYLHPKGLILPVPPIGLISPCESIGLIQSLEKIFSRLLRCERYFNSSSDQGVCQYHEEPLYLNLTTKGSWITTSSYGWTQSSNRDIFWFSVSSLFHFRCICLTDWLFFLAILYRPVNVHSSSLLPSNEPSVH